jgi:hypothetical protein
MSTYLVEYKNKIIGVYNNYYLAETFILSCLQNKIIDDDVLIHHYRENSCFKYDTSTINNKLKLNSKKSILSESSNNKLKLNSKKSNNKLKLNSKKSILSESSYETSSSDDTSTCSDDNKLFSPIILKDDNSLQTMPIDESSSKLLKFTNQRSELQHKINMLKIQKEKIDESKQVYESDLKLFRIFKTSVDTDNNYEIPELFAKKYEIMNKLFNENNLTWENFTEKYKNENYYGEYFTQNSYEEKFLNNTDVIIDEEVDINNI